MDALGAECENLFIVPHVVKNPKSGMKRSHSELDVELPPYRQDLDRGTTLVPYLTPAVTSLVS